MSGKEDEALEILTKAFDKAKQRGDSLDAYELEMLIVEMLIYKVFLYPLRLSSSLIQPQLSFDGVDRSVISAGKINYLIHVIYGNQ